LHFKNGDARRRDAFSHNESAVGAYFLRSSVIASSLKRLTAVDLLRPSAIRMAIRGLTFHNSRSDWSGKHQNLP